MRSGGRAVFSTPRLPIQLLLKHKSTISLFLFHLMPPPPPPPSGAPGSLVRGVKVRSSTENPAAWCPGCGGHSALCRVFPEPHCAKGDAPLIRCLHAFAGETYLVFMPSPIFEFRCAVHGSPSVIYHPTENLRIRSARSRLCCPEPSLLL